MVFLTILGGIVVIMLLILGVIWLATNVYIKNETNEGE